MSLFKLPKHRMEKEQILKLAKKANSRSKLATTVNVSKGGNLHDRINSIKSAVAKEYKGQEDNYEIITDANVLTNYLKIAKKQGVLALDTETTSLDPISCIMAGFSLYTPSLKPAYVPINHIKYMTGVKAENQLDIDTVKEILSLIDCNTKLIKQNAKFDIRVVLNKVGVDLFPFIYWDTMLAGHMLDENEPHGLKEMYDKYCGNGQTSGKYHKLFEGIPFTHIPIKSAYIYAAKDAYMTYELFKFQEQFLDPNHKVCKKRNLVSMANLYHNVEIPLIASTIEMEQTGINIDLEYAVDLEKKLNEELKIKEHNFREICLEYKDEIKRYRLQNTNCKLSDPINISSPDQLAIIFYDIIKIGVIDKRSPRGTGAEILQKITHPIAEAVKEYRGIVKLLSTYVTKMQKELNPITGKVHTSFWQSGTVTTRYSSSDPGLQNIPVRSKLGALVRRMFVPDAGCYFICCDFSQQEPRILAFLSQDENLIEAYRQGKDIYAFIGSFTLKVDYWDCMEKLPDGSDNPDPKGKIRRNQMKAIVLGIMYDRTAVTIAEELKIKTREAQKILNMFFEAFPKVKKFRDESVQEAIDTGYVEMIWGHKRRLPIMQKEKYEFIRISEGVSFDPLDFDSVEESSEPIPVDDDTIDMYWNALDKAWGFNQKFAIKQQAEAEGIQIIDNGLKISEATRQIVNSKIQGSAGIMIKNAMVKCKASKLENSNMISRGTIAEYLTDSKKLDKLGAKIVLQVHDELIFQVPIENAKKASKIISNVMIKSAAEMVEVPMKVDAEIVARWNGDKINV